MTDQTTDCEATAIILIEEYEPSVEMLGAVSDPENNLESLDVLPDEQVICPEGGFDLGVAGEFTSIVWSGSENLVVQGDGSTALYTAAAEDASVTITVTVTFEDGCEATDEVIFNNAELDENATEDFVEELGFYCIDITIQGEATLAGALQEERTTTSACDEDDCEAEDAVCVRDDARLRIAIDGEEVSDLYDSTHDYLSYFVEEFGYPSARAYISYEGDACACGEGENYLEKIREQFEEDELAFWFVITGEISAGSPGKLCVLANVPSSEEHYPVTEERKDFMAFNLQIAEDDEGTGGLASEADQKHFTLFDASSDSHLNFNVGESGPTVLCDGALYNTPWIVAPSGIPMQLPQEATLSWLFSSQWASTVTKGSLAGFTDWTGTKPKYYGGRLEKPDLSSEDGQVLFERFSGYQQYATRRDVYLGAVYPSPVVEDYSGITNFYAGIPDDALDPSSIEIFTCSPRITNFQAQNLLPTGETTEGEADLFEAEIIVSEDATVLLDPSGQGSEIFTLPDIDITGAQFTDVTPREGQDASVFQLTHEDEEGNITNSYVLGVINSQNKLEVYLFDCFSGAYDIPVALEDIPSAQLQEIAAVTLANQRDEQNTEEETVELGKSVCVQFSTEEAAALGMSYEYAPDPLVLPTFNVVNYAQASEAVIQQFSDEVGRGLAMSDAEVHIQFVLSVDDELIPTSADNEVIDNSGDKAVDLFLNGAMSRIDGTGGTGTPDMKVFVHFMAGGGVMTCLRFADDFFVELDVEELTFINEEGNEQSITQIPTEQGVRLQNMAFQTWEGGLKLVANTDELSNAVEGCSSGNDSSGEGRPGYYGVRPGAPEFDLANLSTEIGMLTSDIVKDAEISEAFVKASLPNGQPIEYNTEAGEFPIAIANKIAATNPYVGFYQLATFAYTVFKDEQTRCALAAAVSDLPALAASIWNNKKNVYLNGTAEDRRWESGNDIGAIYEFVVGGGAQSLLNLAEKIRGLGKKADDAALRLTDDLPFDSGNLSRAEYIEQIRQAFRTSDGDNPLDGFTIDDVNDFFNDFVGKKFDGDLPNARKLMDNPNLIRFWKKFKDAGQLCTGGSTGPCKDLADFVKKLPDTPNPDFYQKFNEIFPDTPEGVEKVGRFLDDAADPTFAAAFMAMKGEPKLLNAWEGLYPFYALRINNSWLERAARWIDGGSQLIQNGAKIDIIRGGNIIGEIIEGKLHVKYPHFGGDIVCHPTKTTTIVGKHSNEVEPGGIGEVINTDLAIKGENPGGVNAYDVDAVEVPDIGDWENNRQWLAEAAERGDVIRATADPELEVNISNPSSALGDGLSGYGREVKYLTDPEPSGLGYVFDRETFTFIKY